MYARSSWVVNVAQMSLRSAMALCLLLDGVGGCVSAQSTPRAPAANLAVVYDLEPMLVGQGESVDSIQTAFRRDFQEVTRLGFDAIIADEVDPKFIPMLKSAAEPAHVALVVADSSNSPNGSLRATIDRIWIGRLKPAIVRLDKAGPDANSLAESLLGKYHSALLEGRTEGLVISRFRSLPGDGPDVESIAAGRDMKALAGFTRLIERYRRWDEYLHGAEVLDVDSVGGESGVKIASMKRDTRRFALIANVQAERSFHGDVEVGGDRAKIGDVESAVEIPNSSDEPVGRVFHGHGGGVVIRTDLSPGDAMLVELF